MFYVWMGLAFYSGLGAGYFLSICLLDTAGRLLPPTED